MRSGDHEMAASMTCSLPDLQRSVSNKKPQLIRMPIAIVTGAARGIGRAIALTLAADGNDVAVCTPSPPPTLEGLNADGGVERFLMFRPTLRVSKSSKARSRAKVSSRCISAMRFSHFHVWTNTKHDEGRKSKAIIGDITKEDDVQSLIQTVAEEFGELNVCIHPSLPTFHSFQVLGVHLLTIKF